MAEQSFISAVERALKSGQLSPREAKIALQQAQLSPNERKIKTASNLKRMGNVPPTSPPPSAGVIATGPNTSIVPVRGGVDQPNMRDAGRGKGRTVSPPRLTGETPRVVPKAGVLRGLGRVAAPLYAIDQAIQTGNLIFSEDARDQAAQDYADSANENALLRTVKGGLGGVKTIYGTGAAINELANINASNVKSQRELEKLQKDPKNQQLLAAAKERQATYMSLPKEEQKLVDKMRGREAKQYLQDKKDGKAPSRERPASSEPAPASSEPAPPSSPATAGAQRAPTERQMDVTEVMSKEAPKAIPVAEPVDEDRAMALFQNTHGGPFDPKSSMDKGKMDVILNLMAQKGSENLTPNQFALKIYRMSK